MSHLDAGSPPCAHIVVNRHRRLWCCSTPNVQIVRTGAVGDAMIYSPSEALEIEGKQVMHEPIRIHHQLRHYNNMVERTRHEYYHVEVCRGMPGTSGYHSASGADADFCVALRKAVTEWRFWRDMGVK
jgi:hypothetical protein